MPRLLIVSTVAETLEGFLLPHAEHFRRRGWVVEAAAQGAATNAACLREFDRVFDVPWSRSPRDVRRQLQGLVAIRRLMRRRSYDIVHTHTPVASFLTRTAVATLSRRVRPKLVYTAHGFHFHPEGSVTGNVLYGGIERLGGLWTDRLVVINEEDRRSARSRAIVAPGKVVLRPRRRDRPHHLPAFKGSRSQSRGQGRAGDPCRGPFRVDGGGVQQREAASRRDLGAGAHGTPHRPSGDGRHRPPGGGAAEPGSRSGSGHRLRFLGFRRDVPRLMQSADVLVLPSSREGLSRSIMEAQAIGLPVLGADIRGIRDLLDEDRGVLYPVRNVRRLAQSLDRILAEPEDAARRAATARTLVGRYDMSVILRAYEQLYLDLLDTRRCEITPIAGRCGLGRSIHHLPHPV